MIKIECRDDLVFLQKKNINPIITNYLTDYYEMLIKSIHCNDLKEIGAIYFLESSEDIQKHTELGLSNILENSLPEFTECIKIKSKINEVKLLHSCFVLSNSCAISVFTEIGTLEKSTENYLLQDSISVTTEIN